LYFNPFTIFLSKISLSSTLNSDNPIELYSFFVNLLKKAEMKRILLIASVFLFCLDLSAQNLPSGFSPELMLRGSNVTQEELKIKLAEKGIDIEQIEAEDLPYIQGEIEAAIKEIQESKIIVKDEANISETAKEDKKSDVSSDPNTETKIKDTKKSIDLTTLNSDPVKIEDRIYGHSVFFDRTLDYIENTRVGVARRLRAWGW
jgi:hypothetical protein